MQPAVRAYTPDFEWVGQDLGTPEVLLDRFPANPRRRLSAVSRKTYGYFDIEVSRKVRFGIRGTEFSGGSPLWYCIGPNPPDYVWIEIWLVPGDWSDSWGSPPDTRVVRKLRFTPPAYDSTTWDGPYYGTQPVPHEVTWFVGVDDGLEYFDLPAGHYSIYVEYAYAIANLLSADAAGGDVLPISIEGRRPYLGRELTAGDLDFPITDIGSHSDKTIILATDTAGVMRYGGYPVRIIGTSETRFSLSEGAGFYTELLTMGHGIDNYGVPITLRYSPVDPDVYGVVYNAELQLQQDADISACVIADALCDAISAIVLSAPSPKIPTVAQADSQGLNPFIPMGNLAPGIADSTSPATDQSLAITLAPSVADATSNAAAPALASLSLLPSVGDCGSVDGYAPTLPASVTTYYFRTNGTLQTTAQTPLSYILSSAVTPWFKARAGTAAWGGNANIDYGQPDGTYPCVFTFTAAGGETSVSIGLGLSPGGTEGGVFSFSCPALSAGVHTVTLYITIAYDSDSDSTWASETTNSKLV